MVPPKRFDCALTSAAGRSPRSFAFTLNEVSYLAQAHKGINSVDSAIAISNGPATTIHIGSLSAVDSSVLDGTICSYLARDDVFKQEYLRCIILCGQSGTIENVVFTADAVQRLDAWGTQQVLFIPSNSFESGLLRGPYFIQDETIFRIFHLQPDFNRCFVGPTLQISEDERTWDDLNRPLLHPACTGIPIPSRLYFEQSLERPLDGWRIAIKDVFHLKGTRTSVCNRAYDAFYDPQESTAACLDQLVRCGAQLVGKTHLSSFAWREDPTECVEYQAPFNPRADGLQSPAGSSSGSGAAAASYEWLDVTIGTDSISMKSPRAEDKVTDLFVATGSGRRPALWNGCFAIRPSACVLSLEGIVPTCLRFDVPSVFARDLTVLRKFLPVWYNRTLVPQKPSEPNSWSILYLSEYMDAVTEEQRNCITSFGEALSEFLAGRASTVSMKAKWAGDKPEDSDDFDSYFEHIQSHGFYYDAYHLLDHFRHQYEERHRKRVYVSRPTQWLWDIAAKVTPEQHEEAMRKVEVFRSWFLHQIMAIDEQNTLVLLPIEKLESRYRDETPALPSEAPKGVSMLFVSPALKAPELVVPIGHYPYLSRATGNVEQLPLAVAIMAAPEMDLELVNLICKFLKKTGRPSAVDVGPMMFPDGVVGYL